MPFLKKNIFLSLFLLLFFAISNGKPYYFKHYQVEDGLAHNTVVTIIQDRKGLMWIGTKGGLNRFDGYTFKSYKNASNKFGTIGNNIILSLCEDLDGMIWIGTGQGIYKFDPYKEIFTELSTKPVSSVTNILVDKQNNIWFLSNNILYRYNQHNKKLDNLGIAANCISFDPEMKIWMGTVDGTLKTYNPNTKAIKTIKIITGDVPLSARLISKILFTNQNKILIGTTKQGLKSYDLVTGEIQSLLKFNKDKTEIYVRDIIAANKVEYWVATESGIYVCNLNTHQSQNLKKCIGDNYAITDNAIYCLYKDNQNGLWAGTFFGGINYLSSETIKFEKYYPSSNTNSISGNAVREICSNNSSTIWIGTEDSGINKFDTKTKKFTCYTSNGKHTNISYPNIHGLLAVGNKLYIGPFQHGLEIMDTKSGKITNRYNPVKDGNIQTSDFVMSIYLTLDSTLLIGTTGGGLFTFDPKNKKFKGVKQLPKNSFIYSITEDHEGTIWTGSLERGTYYFNPKTGVSGNIRFNHENSGKTNHDYLIQGIFEDSNHALWFATEGGGLIKLGADRKTIKKFTTANGSPSNNLFRMLEDKQKNLWISSLKGLIRLNLTTEKFVTYKQSNGLITDQFNYNSAFKDQSGKMYFGCVKGMIAFNPQNFGKSGFVPPTYITGFQINNEDVIPNSESSPLKKSILYTDTIVLKHNQSSFNIEFAALSFASPRVIRYKYFMKGLGKDWTYLNSNRKAYFTALSPGNYTFKVSAESNIGNWTGKERKLFIKILPPLWKSNLAFIIYFLVLGTTLYFSINYYHQYLEKKNLNRLQLFELEKEKEIYQAKIEFFTNIAHEIQTPLTLIIGPVERAIKKVDEASGIKKSLQMVEKNANRLLELTTQLLDFRKTEINQFGLSFVSTDITALLKEQVAVFSSEADKNSIKLRIAPSKESTIAFVDMEAFVKITANLLSNAIKYADSKVCVNILPIKSIDKEFIIRFINDGKAIPVEFKKKIFEPFFRMKGNKKPGTGIGLSLAKSLIELHKGSLELITDETGLVIFEMIVPIHQQFEFKLSNWKNLK